MSNNRLKVYVRVRPLEDHERIIDIVDDRTLIFDPRDAESQPNHVHFYHGQKFKTIGIKRHKNMPYTFDGVFDDNSTNRSIFETVTRPMVDATLDGYNCSVFAYGATGSGKTYTMLGRPNNPGVIYHTTKDLFDRLAEISEKDPLPAELKICYFEIYNEKIRDLLVFGEQDNFIRCGNKRLRTTPERCRINKAAIRDAYNLPVCEAPGDGQSLVIPDLSYHTPENAEQLIKLLEAGNANRSQHPTDANADSSRSHAIFQIVLTRRRRRLNNNNHMGSEYELLNSKLSLIDLAGSERASVAYRAGNDRSKNLQREGGNINKSLLALGNCINALADSRGGHKHVPYRNSKLTRLLKDSLGGKCRTAMIATICQQQSHYDDTQNTLVYASRAKCIKTRPGRNFTDVALQPKNYSIVIDNQNKQIAILQSQNDQLKTQLDELRNENANLRHQKMLSQDVRPNPNTTFTASERTPPATNFLDKSCYGPKLMMLYDERGGIKMDILKFESKYRTNELKLTFKMIDRARITNQKTIGNSLSGLTTGLTGVLPNQAQGDQTQALKAQLQFYDEERQTLLDKVDSNAEQIDIVINKMSAEYVSRGFGTQDSFDDLIKSFILEKERDQELEEKKFCEQHAYDLAQLGFNRLMNTEELLNDTIVAIRSVHSIIVGRKLSETLESRLSSLLRMLEGKKSVIWKDDKFERENSKANEPLTHLSSIHENFSLNFLTPFRNNNTLHSRRLSRNLVALASYTPEQSNTTFDASH